MKNRMYLSKIKLDLMRYMVTLPYTESLANAINGLDLCLLDKVQSVSSQMPTNYVDMEELKELRSMFRSISIYQIYMNS